MQWCQSIATTWQDMSALAVYPTYNHTTIHALKSVHLSEG